jgi:hypothetical protein
MDFRDTPAWRAHVRTRMRTNAHLAIRHDAHRCVPHGSPRYVGNDVVRYFWPEAEKQRPQSTERNGQLDQRGLIAEIAAEQRFIKDLRYELAEHKFELAYRRVLRSLKYGYNPNQPRVPAGSREGGRWTSENGAAANNAQPTNTEETIESGHEEPQSILDLSSESEFQPGIQQIAARSRANGHHYVPYGVFGKYPLPPETQKVFEDAKTGPLLDEATNYYDSLHRIYSRAVDDLLKQFMERNNIQPERMTPDQARAFVKEVQDSKDPRIRSLNMRIWMGEVRERLLRRLRGLPE